MHQIQQEIKEKNIKSIDKKRPSLNWVRDYEASNEIEVMCKRGKPTLRVLQGDKKITIHSAFDPEKEAIAWAEAIEKKANTQYVIFGFGLGYHVRALKRLIDEQSTIIVIEPTYDIFCKAIELVDMTDIFEDENVVILASNETSKIIQKLKGVFNVAVYTGLSIIFSALSPYTILYCDTYVQLGHEMADIHKEAVVSKNTTMAFSLSWQENQLKNWNCILNSYTLNGLVNKFTDIPAIIVSAGPSLNKNIDLLKKVEDNAIIISTDTALKALFKHGIKPHFVISIDGSVKNYEKYCGINYDEIPLVFTPKVYWKIINDHKGKKVLFTCGDVSTEFLLSEYDIKVEGLSSGGSVANNALHFAVKMGANPVIFMGQDLAYTNNKSHADGTMYDGKNFVIPDIDEMYVEDVYGGKVLTNRTFYIFLKWFEAFIANDKSDRKYIDSTEGGAYIKGTEVLPLSECIDKYISSDFSITQRINDFFKDDNPIISSLSVREMLDYLKNNKRVLKDISKQCKKAYEMCRDIILEYDKAMIDSKRISGYLRKMDRLDAFIKEKSTEMIMIEHVLEPVIYRSFSGVNTTSRNDENFKNEKEKDISIIQNSLKLYKGIRDAIEYTLPLMNECFEGLEEQVRGQHDGKS